jgi:Nuclear pore complex assembly
VAKLQTLVLVAEALASKSFSTTGPAGTAARTARRILTTSHPTNNAYSGTSNSALPETPSTLIVEANRLLQTTKIMHWLSTQQLLQTNPSGRFSSHSAWQGTVSLRKSGAGSFPLLLTDLIDSVLHHDVDNVSYPPPSPESFITNLFLSGNATVEAFQSKLALLSYSLVDANFLKAPDLVKGVNRHFAVPRTTACVWMLLLFLDDAQLVPVDAPVNSSLNQAVNSLLGIDGSTIPFRALRVFVDRGRGDVALGLLRQSITTNDNLKRKGTDSSYSIAKGDIVAACTALRVRLVNGLLVESFIEMKRYLESLPDTSTTIRTTNINNGGGEGGKLPSQQSHQNIGGVRGQHAHRLIEELLDWGSTTEGGLHGIIGLSISPAHEEPALISWLQRSTHSMPSAGIMLTLYFLMRGRTPEALLAYAQYGKHAAAGAAMVGGAVGALSPSSSSSLVEARRHVEELLRAACRTMPAAQRALVVGIASEPALRFSGEDQEMLGEESGEGGGGGADGGGTALVSALPGLDTGGLPMLISVGPTATEAPLVGGVMTAIARATGTGQGRKERGDEHIIKEPAVTGSKAATPLLFGQTPAGPASGLGRSTPLGSSQQFGAGLMQTQVAAGGAGGGAAASAAAAGGLPTGRRQQHHQLDALLGIAPRTQATGTKGRRTLR